MPDVRKPLSVLQSEWQNCTRCELGARRLANNGAFVFGEGTARGVMFIGEGPGWEEEVGGRPFIGKSGQLLREVVERLGLTDYYISNMVTCRACEPVLDEHGNPMFKQRKKGPPFPILKDRPPTPVEWKTCLARLHEEIYIVDPIVIVSLGVTATEALTGHATSINRDRGKEETISIPGAGFRPVFTEKRRLWQRKVDGQVVTPVETNMVDYLLIPTLHPAFVLRQMADQGPNSPFMKFVEDVRKAIKIFEFYIEQAAGIVPTGRSDATYEEVSAGYLYEEEASE